MELLLAKLGSKLETLFSCWDNCCDWENFFISECFVSTYCGLILLLWLILTGSLVWKSHNLHAKLRALNDELNAIKGEADFTKHFEAYNSKVEAEFDLHWTEFVETLVLPTSGSNLPIQNTVDVSRYLNDSTIVFPRISFSFYRSVPNLLTGLGILGTFLGLAFGVGAASSGISSGQPSEITASLQKLLDGASLAFWTSIFGISLSILFVPVLHSCRRTLHLQMNRWIGKIERRMRRVTPESVALNQLEQARHTTEQLKTFNTELVFSIQQALDEGVAGRLTPQIERLIDAVHGIRSDRSTDAGKLVEQALDRFTIAMQEKTADQFKEMSSIVASLNQTLRDSATGLAESQREAGQTLSSVMTETQNSMVAGAAAMTETLEQSLANVTNTLSGASQGLADHFTESSSNAATELNAVFSSSTRRLADACVEAVSQISRSTGDQFKEMSSIVASLNQTLKNSAAGLADSQKEAGQALSSVMTEAQNSMLAGAAAMTQTLDRSLVDLTNTFSEASQDLADHFAQSGSNVATELNAVFSSAAQRFVDTCVDGVSQISRSLRSLLTVADGLQTSTQSLERSTVQSEQVLQGMTTFTRQINSLRQTIELAHRQIGSAAVGIGQSADTIRASSKETVEATERMRSFIDTVGSNISKLEEHQHSIASAWARYQDRFEDIDHSLARVFRQLDEGLSRYCEQVKAFANELDKTTATTVESLAAATGELSESIEDLTDHLQRPR